MKKFIFLLIVTASAATFHNLKPNKLYKTLVEPLVDGALQGFFTRGVLDPIGHLLTGGKYKHHKKKHHYDHEHHYYGDPHHYNEHELHLHPGGPLAIYHVHHCGSHGGYAHHHHHEGHYDSAGYYGPESLYGHVGHYGSAPYAGGFHHGDIHYDAAASFDPYQHY